MSKRSVQVFAHPLVLPRFFSEAEIARLRAVLPSGSEPVEVRDRAIVEVLLATGLRASELLTLQVGDLRDGLLFVRCGKGGRQRFVPITPEAWALLQRLIPAGARPGDALFVNAWGECLSRRGLHRILRGYLRAAGLKGSTHTTRHTTATRLLDRGLNLRQVQAVLGHAHLSTTAIYCGVALGALRRDYEAAMARPA